MRLDHVASFICYLAAAICRRLRTFPCCRTSDGINILRELSDFCLSVFLVQWPDAFQISLVNGAMRPRFAMHLAFDLSRERFHRCLDIAGKV